MVSCDSYLPLTESRGSFRWSQSEELPPYARPPPPNPTPSPTQGHRIESSLARIKGFGFDFHCYGRLSPHKAFSPQTRSTALHVWRFQHTSKTAMMSTMRTKTSNSKMVHQHLGVMLNIVSSQGRTSSPSSLQYLRYDPSNIPQPRLESSFSIP